jgi:tetratricopeptide (TPR) repeat protein
VTPEERAVLERSAERSLRRGELKESVAAFRALSSAFPDDGALSNRLALVEETLQPSELAAPLGAIHSEPSSGGHASPTHQAEALAARGDFKGAIAIYQQLLQQSPTAELLSERLVELRQLAAATRSRPALSREHLLEHLLDRISTRRRAP